MPARARRMPGPFCRRSPRTSVRTISRRCRSRGTSGFSSAPGASYSPNDDWPRFELTDLFSKQIDFNARFLREQVTRQWGRYPQLGGGQGVPAQGTHALDVALNGNVAWTIAGGGAGPLDREGYMDGVPIAEMRQLDIMLTPHGFVKAALAPGANPAMVTSMPRGRARHLRVDHRAQQVPGDGDDQRPQRDRIRPDARRQPDVRRHALRSTLRPVQAVRQHQVSVGHPSPPG